MAFVSNCLGAERNQKAWLSLGSLNRLCYFSPCLSDTRPIKICVFRISTEEQTGAVAVLRGRVFKIRTGFSLKLLWCGVEQAYRCFPSSLVQRTDMCHEYSDPEAVRIKMSIEAEGLVMVWGACL